MKTYPKIPHFKHIPFGQKCYAFDKLDGSSMRFEWGKKRGFYKYGTRNVMIDKNTPIYGECIDIFLDKYGQNLDDIFRKQYKSVESFVVFGEFFGKGSFAGQHIDGDKKDITIFDINRYKSGFLPPCEFIDIFGHLDIPKVIYEGIYNYELVNSVKLDKFGLMEGVVCKGVIKTKRGVNEVWYTKVKTNKWIQKVRLLYGESALIEEFNNDRTLLNDYVWQV